MGVSKLPCNSPSPSKRLPPPPQPCTPSPAQTEKQDSTWQGDGVVGVPGEWGDCTHLPPPAPGLGFVGLLPRAPLWEGDNTRKFFLNVPREQGL